MNLKQALKATAKRMITLYKDARSLWYQLRGLPHDKTSGQLAAYNRSFDEQRLRSERVQLIAAASGRPEAEIESFVLLANDFRDDADYQRWSNRGKYMPIADRLTLHALVRAFRPRICVETGAAAGSSATVMLAQIARQGEGRLYSVDIDRLRPGEFGELIPNDLRPFWELRLQKLDGAPILPALLKELGQIDLFLHDSLHTFRHMTWEFEAAWQHIRAGGCLATHDVGMTSSFDDFLQIHGAEISHWGKVGGIGFIIRQGEMTGEHDYATTAGAVGVR
jgi:cephalosporin hydroxylase